MDERHLLCIAGPTASGKSTLALELANRLSGEIISADSMQIYRKMNIGTAKPTPSERAAVPHHMIDILEPFEDYSVSRYTQEAGFCVENILSRGKLPIIVGGTGLYLDALINGTAFGELEGSDSLRCELSEYAELKGKEVLYERLKELDPESAAAIHPNNTRRVIRALEVVMLTGVKKSEYDARSHTNPPKWESRVFVLDFNDRGMLYSRIDRRVDEMMDAGLVAEARALWEDPRALSKTASQAIGYKELFSAFCGQISLDEAVSLVKQRTRNYSKRQLTWFKRGSRNRFLVADNMVRDIKKEAAEIIAAMTI